MYNRGLEWEIGARNGDRRRRHEVDWNNNEMAKEVWH
uniref:Uncharacterized protein n=1 Tax=Physcomitrium patens TaxID=3218 RepID=A0A2K1JQA0_PHYPA|nr:hypothetical protein PHYPA_016096 [Physcomitrium patens]